MIERLGIIWIEADRLIEVGDCLAIVADARIGGSASVERVGETRRKLNRLVEILNCRVIILLLETALGAPIERVSVCGASRTALSKSVSASAYLASLK